jgi:hypothetical protein
MNKVHLQNSTTSAFDQSGKGLPMAKDQIISKPMTAISGTTTRLSLAAAVVSMALLAALHVLEPQYAPSWRMVSEYANGNYGWVMTLTFLSMALSCVTLFIAIRPHIRTRGGKIGLGVLLVTAAALVAAASFPMDPITASAGTTHGMLHGFASMIGVPGLPLAAVLISQSLRRNLAWSRARRSLSWAANLAWISFLLLVLTVAIMLPLAGGKFGPDVWTGWANRLVMLAYGWWLITVAWQAIQLRKQRS